MSDPSVPPVVVLGRYPPPTDGQSVATRRLASLLAGERAVIPIDLNPGGAAFVQSRVRLRAGAAWHFTRSGSRVRRVLEARPGVPVLWTTVSPTPLGHLRDVATLLPAFPPGHRVYAVVHHGAFERVFRHPLTRASARRMLPRLDALVFLSEALAARCAPWVPAERRLVIPNTIDDALLCTQTELDAKRARWTAPPGPQRPLRVLFLSHMIPEKGYLDLVRAVGLLRTRGLPVEATFVGRWDSPAGERAFREVAAAAGAADAVTYRGGVEDRAEIRRHYLAADALALPTYYRTEAQPLSVLEAMAAATPVVATAHAGIPEMVPHGAAGLLVPPRDPPALAEALAALLSPERWRALSAGAHAQFRAAFSPEIVRRAWLRLLEAT